MPFGGYKNFAACLKANSDKKDPKAYCATIMRATEEVMPTVKEIIDVSEAEFHTDEETGKMTASLVIIKAGRAKGKLRNYSSQSIRKAAKEGIYDGIRMFVNHSDKPPTKRGMGELVSAVESTSYDVKKDAVVGNVEFFNKEFYDYAQRAKKHIGVSADHRIRVNYVQEGRDRIEDVQEVVGARSVDWVVYPAAGGEIISFARESEGADEVEWTDVTLEDLKAHAPAVLEAFKTELAKESESDEEDEEGTTDKKNKTAQESVTMTREDMVKLVQEQVTSIQTATDEKLRKQTDTTKKVREFVAKSGLKSLTQARIVNQFADAQEYVEADVKEAVDSAKAELAEAGAGKPRISGMGTSGAQEGEGESHVVSVRESVEAQFGIGKKKEKAASGASGKES